MRSGRAVTRPWSAPALLGLVATAILLVGCTAADEEPAPPTPTTSLTGTLTPPADLGDVLLEGSVRLDGPLGWLSATVTNNTGTDLTVTGISCACATGIRMGTLDEGALLPVTGGLTLPAGGTLSFGGEGEPQVELAGLLASTVDGATVPIVAYLPGRPPVQGVAAVGG